MADIRCLICNRVNDASAERCWYCNTLLPRQSGSLTPQEREKLAGIRQNTVAPDNDESTKPADENPQSVQPEPVEESVPDWLERVRQLKQHDEQTDKPDRSDWVAEEQPEWLRDLTGDKSAPSGSTPAAINDEAGLEALEAESIPGAPFDQSDENLEDQDGEDYTGVQQAPFKGDVFAELEASAEVAPDLTPGLSVLSVEGETGNLDSDESIAEEFKAILSTPEVESGADFPIAVEDLPDWLIDERTAGEQQEKPVIEEAQISPPSDKKIEKAHLPAWLASLRPVQSVIGGTPSPETQPEIVDHGVLAGIQGTLPASSSPHQAKEPRVFGSELRLSAAQRRNTEMLRLLLQPEGDELPGGVEKPTGTGENKLLRLLVTILVLLSVIIPIFSPRSRGVTPALYSTEVVDSLGIIQALPENTPVLVTAHFEAGLAGELDWTAQPVLRHLVSRGVPLALTSTNVTGYAILKKMVGDAVGDGTDYSIDVKVVDLGYLPGGTIGLGALVSDPLAALPFTTEIQPVGEVNALKGITSLSDFGALILVTDNPDVARSWIEQIGRSRAPVTTLVLVSAQAAPLVQPYYSSGQVNGIVSGVAGALSYELLRAAPGTASTRFHIYQAALLSAALIILAGGIISWITGAPTRAAKGGNR